MYKILCLNKISPVGTKRFGEKYTFSPEVQEPDGILVRSASMHDMELGENLLAIARAGAVSYTHLDVYKRQAHKHSCFSLRAFANVDRCAGLIPDCLKFR